MIDYNDLQSWLINSGMQRWAGKLSEQIKNGLDPVRYGDISKWQAALEQLPNVQPSSHSINTSVVRFGDREDLDETSRNRLPDVLKQLHPWRKGPFELFGVSINTEWHSDWKWDRLLPHIQPLKNRKILDVGCGNGYYCWRMLGEHAARVIGIDPTPLFVIQFEALKRYSPHSPVHILPMGIDDVPENLNAFDTVFSMGVLYHRRSPLDHLLQLRGCLQTGGELVLETLVIEGDEQACLFPQGRYACMGNVWFLPSTAMLTLWLERCKFKNIRIVDVNQTSTEEQRSTEWMTFQSLTDFLDPSDQSKTIEGYPAPRRATIVAEKS